MNSRDRYNSIYNKIIKRIIDLFLAVVSIILISPILLVISVAIIIDTGFPVFYRAERGAYKGKTFRIMKFRSMVKNADKVGSGTTALNDPRITRVGAFLRKTKLDEIPQLFNILLGDMSFVGPRPELISYTSRYTNHEQVIFLVRPGITDYSSVKFINLDEIVGDSNADEIYEKEVLPIKNVLRVQYAEEVSFIVDVKIFFLTVLHVLKKIKRVIFCREVRWNTRS